MSELRKRLKRRIAKVTLQKNFMRLKEMCADEMPREKMLTKGADALSNTELLAILLRTGRNGKNVINMARELLMSGGGRLSSLAEMSLENFCETDGIGPSKAVAVAAAFEIGRRIAAERATSQAGPVSTPRTVFRLMYPLMKDLDHEECWILLLSKSNRLISKIRMSSGGLDSTTIDCRPIIRKAIEKKASAIILVHNHPSGSALPSIADIDQTKALTKALKICSLSLIDHVIIAKDSYYSFADEELTRG